jgi:hypothetical protein
VDELLLRPLARHQKDVVLVARPHRTLYGGSVTARLPDFGAALDGMTAHPSSGAIRARCRSDGQDDRARRRRFTKIERTPRFRACCPTVTDALQSLWAS